MAQSGDKFNIWNLPEEAVWIQKLHYFMRNVMHYFEINVVLGIFTL